MKRNQSFSPGLASHHHPSIPQIILIIFWGEQRKVYFRARKETGTIPGYTENIPGRDQKGRSTYRAFLEEAKIQQNFER